MTEPLFHHDSYRKQAHAVVTGHTPEGGIVVDKALFHPQGGGQPGDSGDLSWDGGALVIATAIKGPSNTEILIPGSAGVLPAVGTTVLQTLDWDRRYRHMRLHTALHLLCVAVPFPVRASAIGQSEGWVEFKMPKSTIDPTKLHDSLNQFVAMDLPVRQSWVDAEQSPDRRNTRIIHIGEGDHEINQQPCEGTHVAQTSEIGKLSVGKIENNGPEIRRITIQIEHNAPVHDA